MHTYTRYTHSALSSTNELIHDEFYQGSREPINSGVCCLYTMRMSDAHMQTEYYVPSCCFSLGIHHPDLLWNCAQACGASFSWVYSVVSTCCITTKYFFSPLILRAFRSLTQPSEWVRTEYHLLVKSAAEACL